MAKSFLTEYEANALCEYMGYDFKENEQFYLFLKENGLIEVYDESIDENVYIKEEEM